MDDQAYEKLTALADIQVLLADMNQQSYKLKVAMEHACAQEGEQCEHARERLQQHHERRKQLIAKRTAIMKGKR